MFPSLSGKTSIRTSHQITVFSKALERGFHPFQGRPPFGQALSVAPLTVYKWLCFHPFQGRPLFGPWSRPGREGRRRFHPFQGRPLFGHITFGPRSYSLYTPFPSLSGKTSIRTGDRKANENGETPSVSIPFREDLYSDTFKITEERPKNDSVSIPFREDLHSDNHTHTQVVLLSFWRFHPFQGRPSFGQKYRKL